MGLAFYYWLSADPPVLHHQALGDRDFGEHLPTTRMYRLVKFTCRTTADAVLADYARAKKVRPEHRIHYLLDEAHVADEARARGAPAHFIHQNAFLDERIYDVQPEEPKRYDALYNAWFNPVKRHALAAGVPSLVLIGGSSGFLGPGDRDAYLKGVRAALGRAHFVNLDSNRFLGDREVAQWINRARVGLCLSASEGGMYVATEYLLCGVPVVSTASEGGRDHWFDPGCARIVAAAPEAVAAGVRDLISLSPSPTEIRRGALQKCWSHRRRLIDLVQSFFDEERAGRDYAREFYARFTTKLGHWRPPEEAVRHFATDAPPGA
ncbi:MAG TPA: glycosyltransferase [Pirellulales bacterium]